MIEIVIEIGIRCSTMVCALPTFGIVERYTEIAVFFLQLTPVDFSQNFSERASVHLKNPSRFQSRIQSRVRLIKFLMLGSYFEVED